MKLGEYLCKSFTFMISLLAHDHGYGPVIQYIIFTSLTTVYYENSACTHYSKTSLIFYEVEHDSDGEIAYIGKAAGFVCKKESWQELFVCTDCVRNHSRIRKSK